MPVDELSNVDRYSPEVATGLGTKVRSFQRYMLQSRNNEKQPFFHRVVTECHKGKGLLLPRISFDPSDDDLSMIGFKI